MTTLIGAILCALGPALGPVDIDGDPSGVNEAMAPVEMTGNAAVWNDTPDDAEERRTDTSTEDGPPAVMPDIISVALAGWNPLNAVSNPYDGSTVAGNLANIVRIDLLVSGLVNPPGPVGMNGRPNDPFRFGDRAIFGFIDIDIDGNLNTGGEFAPEANLKFLANAARFGGLYHGANVLRGAANGAEIDSNYVTDPQYERSGADFVLDLSGHEDVILVSGDADGDGMFGEDETIIVRSRFFHRTTGYQLASKAFGGSEPGLYDPWVDLRFKHFPGMAGDLTDGETLITLIFPLNMQGAAILAGRPMMVEPRDFDVSNDVSVQEAMLDVKDALVASPPAFPTSELTSDWLMQSVVGSLNPTTWSLTAIVGTAANNGLSHYVFTDVGFELRVGDVNGDDAQSMVDRAIVLNTIGVRDGTPIDDDGVVNGEIVIPNFARNFDVLDVDGDGLINAIDADLAFTPPDNVPGDINGDGQVNAVDLAILIGLWGSVDPAADLNDDGVVNAQDLAILIGNWG